MCSSDLMTAAVNRAVDFSSKYPTYAITPQKIKESFKDRSEQKAIAEAVGARVSKKDIPIVSPMLQYGKE